MNTGSTTESEVVGVSDYLPNTIWLMRFISAIQMERHGKRSSSRRTRHFDIRFFNVKDKLQANKVRVVYYPTEKRVADFFTKPLQGAQFRLLRRVIMGMDPVSILELSKGELVGPKERVGSDISQNHFIGRKRYSDGPSYADAVKGKKQQKMIACPSQPHIAFQVKR